MNSEAQTAIIVMAVATILPIPVAWICFHVMKSSGEVSGPLHGFKARFGGAFAAYFAVFLALLYIRPVDLDHIHTYTVVGTIDFQQAAGEPEPNLNDVFVRVVPPRLAVMNQGAFRWEIPVQEAADGTLVWPDVQVDLRGYKGQTVPLSPGHTYGAQPREIARDDRARQLFLKAPIILQSIAVSQPYKATTAETAVAIR